MQQHHKPTPLSHTQRVWVCDGVCVFCLNGKPYAFNHNELNTIHLIGQDGVVCMQHFNNGDIQVSAVDYFLVKEKLINLMDGDGEFIPYRHIISLIDVHAAYELSAGIQLLLWQKSNRFCGYCGVKTYINDAENVITCPACHQQFYPKIQPCIIVAITRSCLDTSNTQILLAQHHHHSNTGMYGLIAGYMEVGENVEMAICREIMEEIGLTVDNIRYIKSQAWPYPSNLMLGFMAEYVSGEIIIDNKELSHAQFFSKESLPLIPPKGTIAFELIRQALSL